MPPNWIKKKVCKKNSVWLLLNLIISSYNSPVSFQIMDYRRGCNVSAKYPKQLHYWIIAMNHSSALSSSSFFSYSQSFPQFFSSSPLFQNCTQNREFINSICTLSFNIIIIFLLFVSCICLYTFGPIYGLLTQNLIFFLSFFFWFLNWKWKNNNFWCEYTLMMILATVCPSVCLSMCTCVS